ncbi:UDP-glucuronosyltransferase 1A1-like [Lampris incognitus]|uniref:UDP-glucuronosyltransferase 1A1-like n=1 Tax=Lampris incognitus TaxID=2546036 RepID=UPI0024B5A0C6|nr:UDP-glucuronosyltransferase 1A1-like [Lampris incognitus]
MRKAMVFVCLLFSIALELNGATNEPNLSARPEWELRTAETKAGVVGSISDNVRNSTGFSGHLLVVPMDGSHWIGIKAIAQAMGRRGHQVTVLIPEVSIRMGPGKHYSTLTYPVPYGEEEIDSVLGLDTEVIRKSSQSFKEKISSRIYQVEKIVGFIHTTAESLLFNASLIANLAQQSFDAVLTDPFIPTGSLIARKLGLPTVNLLRGIPCSMHVTSAACPSPPSYVPRFFSGFTDKMNFMQRVINTLISLMDPLLCRLLYWRFDQIAYQFLGEDVSIADVLSDSAIWLLRTDFILEFPRPLMPNVVLVGGINCNMRNPLPEDLESWLSGEYGFVVFTLGSMIKALPEDKNAIFLEAFRQIPQKVVWRYTGPVPENIPENVKLMKWVPQNDLLAHRGIRAFITHAGSHGIYEGLCHGVPMVMLPINGDQFGNAYAMASRGMGVVLDIPTISVDTVLLGLNEVINDTRYKDSAVKLSALHKDRPIDPLDLSVYWTEFVMRHKGAHHLRPAAHDLNWLQYHSLDVILLLVMLMAVVVILTVKSMRMCLSRLSRKRKQE